MIKRIAVAALATAMLFVMASPVAAAAETGIKVTNSSAEADFPYYLNFFIEAESNADITDIRLHYWVERDSFASVTSEIDVELTPSENITAGWTMEMIKSGGLPPGTVINYWWTLADADGSSLQTEVYQVQFNDERYQWQSIGEGNITLYWYSGDDAFINQIMQAAQTALGRITEDTGAYLEKPVRLYIYASSSDMRGAMIFPQEWAGGVAFTTYGTVIIGINEGNLEWGKRAIAHELMHLVTHQMTYNPYNSIPTWLNEGLSMYAEGEMEDYFASYLKQAVLQDKLISVKSLASPFSANARISYQSYAQSLSLVEYLIDNYGQDGMFELLSTFRQGSSYDAALLEVYGFDMSWLNDLWQEYIIKQYKPEAVGVSSRLHTAALSAVVAITMLAMGMVAGRRLCRR